MYDSNEKIFNNPASIVELMITYVESGVEFTNNYGDIDEVFCLKIENMYEKLLLALVKTILRIRM